jgi:RsiW-degrading membrane proteinase PrsW (M82 family)
MAYPRTLLARELVDSPLRRPLAGCAFWAVMLGLLGIAFLGHITLWITEPLAASAVFVGTALLATLASVPALLLLWLLDRRERESIWLFGGAVWWGAVVSTGISGVLNSLGGLFIAVGTEAMTGSAQEVATNLLTGALVAPPVEEAAKGLALLVLFWFLRAEFDNLRDGLIYGALVGLGFNIAEIALYVMKGYIDTGVAPIAEQFTVRLVFLGLEGHLVYTALTGAGLGLARQTASGCLRLAAPIGGYLLATLAHALNNSLGVVVFAGFLVVQGVDLDAGFTGVPIPALWLATALSTVLV